MRDFQIRLMYDLYKYPNSYFITLTFDEPNLQRFQDNPNQALRLFLDRLRKECFNKQVRHWFVAEYGKKHGRLHFHGFLFDLPFKNPNDVATLILSKWKYGLTDAQPCDDKAPKYAAKYTTKSINNGKKPPRILCSKGIGEGYLDPENIDFHKSRFGDLRPFISYRGLKIPLPRYYYSKIFSDEDKIQMLREREEMQTPLVWQGKKYKNLVDFTLARRATFKRNLNLGLSKQRKLKLKDYVSKSIQNPTGLQETSSPLCQGLERTT